MKVNDASDQAVIASLANALALHIHEWYGAGAELDSKAISLRKYLYSFFLECPIKTSAGDQTLLVKIHRKPAIQTLTEALSVEHLRSLARNEYEISQAIWRAFEGEGLPECKAVEYLGFLEEWNALPMRQVKGQMLKEYLLRPGVVAHSLNSMDRLQRLLSISANWLRIFHRRVSGLQIVSFPVEEAARWMQEVLAKLQVHSKNQVNVMPYRKGLERMLDDLGALKVPVGLLHADFQYSNILVTTDGGVCVLDYSLNRRGPIYFDLATILIDPPTRKAQILTGGRFVAPGFIQACNRAFLDSYFNGDWHSVKALDFYCALAALNKWSADEADFSAHPSAMNWMFMQMTRRYYAETISKYL